MIPASQQVLDPLEQDIHVGIDIVWREARASRAIDAIRPQQRLGAMVAAAQRKPSLIERPANIVRGKSLDRERDDAATIAGIKRADDRTPASLVRPSINRRVRRSSCA